MEHVSVKFEYEYTTKDGRRVSIKPNESYILVSKTNDHWWHVRKDQHTKPFYIPAQYVEELSATGGDHLRPNKLNSAQGLTVSKPVDMTNVKPRKGTTKSRPSSQDVPKETYRFSTFGFGDDLPEVKTDVQTNSTFVHTLNNVKTHNSAPPKAESTQVYAKPHLVPKVIKEKKESKISLQDDTAEQTSVHDEDMDFPLPPPPTYDTIPELIVTEFDTFPEPPPPPLVSLDTQPPERQSFRQSAEKTSIQVPPTEQVQDENLRSAVYVNVAELRKSISESPPSAPSSYSPSYLNPEGWEVHVDDESGQEYYYNPNTGRTTWDSPFVDPSTDLEPLPAEEPYSPSPPQSPQSTASPPAWTSDWEQLVDETSGRPYFYNPMSGETSWEPPEQPQSPYPPLMEPMSVHRFHEDERPPLPEEDYPSEDYPPADPPEGYEDTHATGPPAPNPKDYSFSHVTRTVIPRANLDRNTPAGWNLTVEQDGTWVFTSENSPDQWIKSLDEQGQTYYYLRDGSKSLWNLPEAPVAYSQLRVENGIEADGVSVIKNWRHTVGPAQFGSAQEDGRFGPTHRRNTSDYSSSDSSSTGNSPETQQNVQNLEKAGILNKTKVSENGRKVRKNWAPTWTVLHGGVLTFHKDPKSASGAANKTNHIVPEVAVELRGATIGWATKDKSSKKNVLELKGKNGVEFLLQYDTESIITDWHKVLVDTIRQLEYQEHHSEEEDADIYEKIPNTDEKVGGAADKRKSRGSVTSTTATTTAAETDQKKVRTKLMKFLMKRPTLQTVKEKGYIRENVFGCDLATLCAHEKTTVPSFVEKCIHAVERRGLDIDGLYRVSGNLAVIQKLRFKADHDELDLEDGQWEDVHVITGALKLFFRELSEPLFPYSHFNNFISAIRIGDYNTKRDHMYDLIHSLPDPNHDTMKLLFGHLHRVIEYGQDNRMTVQNVAIVFGPTLLRPEMESGNIAMHMVFQNQIVEFVLNEYDYLFQ